MPDTASAALFLMPYAGGVFRFLRPCCLPICWAEEKVPDRHHNRALRASLAAMEEYGAHGFLRVL